MAAARGALVAAAALLLAGCASPNKGDGFVRSERLFAAGCFDGAYNLGPSFFAVEPYKNTQRERIQRGNDLVENADGVIVLIDDTARIRSELLGKPLRVGLAPDVRPPNTPLIVEADPPLVHIAVYLNETCHGTNTTLYGLSGTITFRALFDGDPNEGSANAKLTDADFDIQVGDPRDQPAGGGAVPTARISHVVGTFRFYFQRGQPGQPFPLAIPPPVHERLKLGSQHGTFATAEGTSLPTLPRVFIGQSLTAGAVARAAARLMTRACLGIARFS